MGAVACYALTVLYVAHFRGSGLGQRSDQLEVQQLVVGLEIRATEGGPVRESL